MTNGAIMSNGFVNTVATDNHITAAGSDFVSLTLPQMFLPTQD
jgi:hypothetical protein